MPLSRALLASALLVAAGCGGGSGRPVCGAGTADCHGACAAITSDDAHCGAGSCTTACSGGKHCVAGTCQASKIEHVVLIVQENHTFESYFGQYCQAPAGSNPSCTGGRACCEGAPMVNGFYTEPRGARALVLDDDPGNDASNFKHDRDHAQACELQQIHGGAMDQFVTGASGASTCFGVGPSCSDPLNWALADGSTPAATVSAYWGLAAGNALADRYFQPVAGGSASNDMYFAGARFRFVDNANMPDVAVGTSSSGLCVDSGGCIGATRKTFDAETIAGLLLDHGKTFAVYADGYAAAHDAAKAGQCADPGAATECPYHSCSVIGGHPVACHGCIYDPSDIPFLYFRRFVDSPAGGGFVPSPYVKDLAALRQDLASQALPSFAFVKARAFHNEHPNVSTIGDGVAFVTATVDLILASSAYRDNTLILVTWDEGGGFFDHVSPPGSPPASVDADDAGQPVPYGTRVPLLAIGPFAKQGTVSHVVMEHSSIVKFLEYNFVGPVGQLGARDGWVSNLGSLLDPAKTGVPVP